MNKFLSFGGVGRLTLSPSDRSGLAVSPSFQFGDGYNFIFNKQIWETNILGKKAHMHILSNAKSFF